MGSINLEPVYLDNVAMALTEFSAYIDLVVKLHGPNDRQTGEAYVIRESNQPTNQAANMDRYRACHRYYFRGLAYQLGQQPSKAIEDFEQAIRIIQFQRDEAAKVTSDDSKTLELDLVLEELRGKVLNDTASYQVRYPSYRSSHTLMMIRLIVLQLEEVVAEAKEASAPKPKAKPNESSSSSSSGVETIGFGSASSSSSSSSSSTAPVRVLGTFGSGAKKREREESSSSSSSSSSSGADKSEDGTEHEAKRPRTEEAV